MNLLTATVREAARRFGDRPALVAADASATLALTYRDLDTVTLQVAHGLELAGVRAGDVVALVVPSSVEYVVLHLALARLGAITAGVNPRMPDGEVVRAITTVGADHVLTTSTRQEALRRSAPSLIEVAVDPTASAQDVLASLRPERDVRHRKRPDCAERPRALVLTSGTTGAPKVAVFTDRQFAAIGALDAGPATGPAWGGGGPMLLATEPVHVGLMTKLAWYLRRGHALHVLRRWTAAAALEVIERERIPVIGGVSAQIALLLREDLEARDLDHVQALIVGGGPSPAPLVEEARRRFGAAYSIRWSSTESGGVGTGTAFDAPDDEALHTVGRPRTGVEVAVRDDAGRDLADGDVGRLWLRSPAVTAGLWQDPDATARLLVDGWLRTDDLGHRRPDGAIVLAGRADDVYIRGGYNVHPGRVEAALLAHPAIADALVAGVADPVLGEVGAALIVRRDGGGDVPADLTEFLSSRLARHELPARVRVVPALPVTAMGKRDRRAVGGLVASA